MYYYTLQYQFTEMETTLNDFSSKLQDPQRKVSHKDIIDILYLLLDFMIKANPMLELNQKVPLEKKVINDLHINCREVLIPSNIDQDQEWNNSRSVRIIQVKPYFRIFQSNGQICVETSFVATDAKEYSYTLNMRLPARQDMNDYRQYKDHAMMDTTQLDNLNEMIVANYASYTNSCYRKTRYFKQDAQLLILNQYFVNSTTFLQASSPRMTNLNDICSVHEQSNQILDSYDPEMDKFEWNRKVFREHLKLVTKDTLKKFMHE